MQARADKDPAYRAWLVGLAVAWAKGEITSEEREEKRLNPDLYMPRPARKKRALPKLAACEAYWGVEPCTCIRCGAIARCERAHVIDRCFGGLDGVQNIVPLCAKCHKGMPSHRPGEEGRALAWLAHKGDWDDWLEALCAAQIEQYPHEAAAVVREDTHEAVERFVRECRIDFSDFPQIRKAEAP